MDVDALTFEVIGSGGRGLADFSYVRSRRFPLEDYEFSS